MDIHVTGGDVWGALAAIAVLCTTALQVLTARRVDAVHKTLNGGPYAPAKRAPRARRAAQELQDGTPQSSGGTTA
jgi:hypothetical protein